MEVIWNTREANGQHSGEPVTAGGSRLSRCSTAERGRSKWLQRARALPEFGMFGAK